MIRGMIGNKTGTAGTLFKQQSHMFNHIWVKTGTVAVNEEFNPESRHIDNSYRQDKAYTPPPALFTEIEGHEYQDEDVEGSPENRVAQIWKNLVENRICKLAVQDFEQVLIPFHQTLH